MTAHRLPPTAARRRLFLTGVALGLLAIAPMSWAWLSTPRETSLDGVLAARS